MQIRPATPDDAEVIAAIYNDAIVNTTSILWHEPKDASLWRERLTDRPAHLPALVAVNHEGQVLGFTTLGPYDDKCGYDDVAEWSLYIAPGWRGMGIGRSLADAVIKTARHNKKLHSLVSRVTVGNKPSSRLHERFGFREVGRFMKLGHKFGQRHDVIAYQLVL